MDYAIPLHKWHYQISPNSWRQACGENIRTPCIGIWPRLLLCLKMKITLNAMVNFDCWRPQHMPTCCLRLMVSYMLGNYCPRSCQQNSNSIIEKRIIFPNVWSSHLNCLILSCEGHCLHVSLYLLITYLNIGVNVTLLNLSPSLLWVERVVCQWGHYSPTRWLWGFVSLFWSILFLHGLAYAS